MPAIRTLIVFFSFVSLGLAADNAKLRTLNGRTIEGDLVSIAEKEIVVRGKDGNISTPMTEVLDLDLRPSAVPAGTNYVDVELTDGTLLHCSQFSLKKNEVQLKLLSGQELKLPLSAVSNMVKDAQDADVRAEWQRILSKQGKHDLLAIKKEKTVNALDGTLGEGDDKGETIGFQLGGKNIDVKLERVHGLSFFRQLNPAAVPTLCKIYDVSGNLLTASKIEPIANGYAITTISGVKLDYPATALARLDFSKGKLTFLSDLEPTNKVERSSLGGVDHYRRDKNLNGNSIKLAGQVYAKGLAIPAYTELEYDIAGDYKEFRAIIGVDDLVGGDSHVKVVIEGDGNPLGTFEIKRGDNKTVPVALDVKNIKKLRIVVSSVNILDLGDHVDLADAKVSK